MLLLEPDADHPKALASLLRLDHPVELFLPHPLVQDMSQEFSRRPDRLVRPPAHVLRDLGVLSVVVEDPLSVLHSRTPQDQPLGLESHW